MIFHSLHFTSYLKRLIKNLIKKAFLEASLVWQEFTNRLEKWTYSSSLKRKHSTNMDFMK